MPTLIILQDVCGVMYGHNRRKKLNDQVATIVVVTLQTFTWVKLDLLTVYLGKLDFLSVTDFSLSNLPRESEKQTSLANKNQ